MVRMRFLGQDILQILKMELIIFSFHLVLLQEPPFHAKCWTFSGNGDKFQIPKKVSEKVETPIYYFPYTKVTVKKTQLNIAR